MRTTIILLALIYTTVGSQIPQQPQLPPPPPPDTGKISGVVTHSITGRPVEGVTIRMVRWEGGLGQQIPAIRTGADGRFVVERLRAGDYTITCTAPAFVSLQFGQRNPQDTPKRIDLKDGQHFDKADIALPPTSAIEGRLLDEFGDPAPGIAVQVARVQFVAGKRRLMPVGGAAAPKPTDDLGRFRVPDLPPGDYYLMALAGPFAGPADPSGFAVTYFPGTTAPMEAQPVRVAIGQDTPGVAFSLTPAPMSTVSGVMVDETDKPVSQGTVMLIQTSGGDVRSIILGRVGTGADGAFTFRNVAPGSYVIQAYGRPVGGGNLGRSPFLSWPLTLAGSTEVSDLRLKVRPGATLRGKIVLDGDALPPPAARILISLLPINFASAPLGGGPAPNIIRDDLTFEVSNMTGIRTINVFAPRWTVKRITRDGRDITDEPVDFRAGDVNAVEITLTSRGPVLTGSVTDNAPVIECTVIAFAEDSTRWAFPSRHFSQVRPDPKGFFQIGGLPAGDYLVLALPNASVQGTDWQDPEFLKQRAGLATRVTIADATTTTVTLKVVR